MADIENDQRSHSARENTPLLPSDYLHLRTLSSDDFIACHIRKIHGDESWVWSLRRRLQELLTSKWGHYCVLILVTLDTACIFADFLIALHICEHSREQRFNRRGWNTTISVLEYTSLAFSCLFMAELLGSVFAFGFG